MGGIGFASRSHETVARLLTWDAEDLLTTRDPLAGVEGQTHVRRSSP